MLGEPAGCIVPGCSLYSSALVSVGDVSLARVQESTCRSSRAVLLLRLFVRSGSWLVSAVHLPRAARRIRIS